MAVLHLMVGLPCSGKTTHARELEKECQALLLTPDAWHLQLFGNDTLAESHNRNHGIVESIMWSVAERALELGVNVILDYGFWAREERDGLRKKALDMGVECKIHYMDVSREELLIRLEKRNREAPPGTFTIPEFEMIRYMDLFQPPTADELL